MAETGSDLRLNAIAKDNNHVKVIMVDVSFYLTITFLPN